MIVKRDNQPLSDYLLKILTILVKRADGELRIDAVDMIDDTLDGLSRRYDRDAKQLVLTFLSASTDIIRPEGDKWQEEAIDPHSSLTLNDPRSSTLQPSEPSTKMDSSSSSLLNSQPLSNSHHLSQLDLNQQLSQPPRVSYQNRSGSTLDDAKIADLEDYHRKEAAARLIANFPSTPVTSPSRRPLRVSSQSQQRQPSSAATVVKPVPPSYYKD